MCALPSDKHVEGAAFHFALLFVSQAIHLQIRLGNTLRREGENEHTSFTACSPYLAVSPRGEELWSVRVMR